MQEEIKKYRKLLKELRDDSKTFRNTWVDIKDYMLPRSGRFLSGRNSSETNNGSRNDGKIINATATDALDVLAAGMQGGLTSPSRPWFVLSLANEEKMEVASVRSWLHRVRQSMLDVFQASNLYGAISSVYKEVGGFGVSAMFMSADPKTLIRFRPFTVGEFYIRLDASYRVSSLIREFDLSARQIVERFGEKNVSIKIKEASEKNPEKRFGVVHYCGPNTDIDESKADYRGMAYKSVYFEAKSTENVALSVAGYREQPFVAPRWDVTGVDTYGGSPGQKSLGDTMMLQKMEEKKLKALDKMVDPPMKANPSLKGHSKNTLSGGVTYVEESAGASAFGPVYQVRPDFQNMAFEIDRVESRIKRFFYSDLFISILNQNKRMTAAEVSERHEEKLLILGPVLERIQSELLDPIIKRTFSLMESTPNYLPPRPPELEDEDIKIEYISLLAQAQKMVGITAIQQTAMFVGELAGLFPEVRDKFDADEAVDLYAESVGTPPKLIKSDDVVAEIRAANAQEAAQAQQMEQMPQTVEAAKTLSEIDPSEDSTLEQLLGGI